MPRLKPSNRVENKISKAGKTFISKIKEKAYLKGMNYTAIAVAMRTSQRTYYDRMKAPKKTTLEEFITLGEKLNFTAEDILDIFGKEVKK